MDPEHDERGEVFADLVRRNYSALFDFAYSYLRDAQDAEDVVQDVLLRVWERSEEVLSQPAVRGYLFRAVRNRALNALRDAKANEDLDAARVADASTDDVQLRELVRDYQAAVVALPER